MPFGAVLRIYTGNKCVKFRVKILSGCSKNGKKNFARCFFFCGALYTDVVYFVNLDVDVLAVKREQTVPHGGS